jgi:futalosine hydrolase
MMKTLIVAATEAEIAPLTAYLHTSGRPGEVILLSGVGMMATAYALTKHLGSNKYDFVLQAGIAGSYVHNLPPGSLVFVTSDRYGDLGAEDHDNYLDIFEMGLMAKNSAPYTDGSLVTPLLPVHNKISLPHVSGLTVNTVSGNEKTIAHRVKKFASNIESMEGAAFHYVCLQEGVPFAQIRAISNYVTPRDKSLWKMKEAITNLNAWLIGFIENL